jgi:hypothetical protein
MTVSAGDLLRVVAYRDTSLGRLANTFYLQVGGSGGVDNTVALDRVAVWVGSIFDNGRNYIHNSVPNISLQVAKVQWIAGVITETEIVGEVSGIGSTAGIGTNSRVAEGVAVLVTLPTTAPKTRGRKFIGGLDQSAMSTDGSIVSGALAAFAAWAADMIAGYSADGLTYLPFVFRSQTGLPVVLFNAVVRVAAAYQRRRKRGVGI